MQCGIDTILTLLFADDMVLVAPSCNEQPCQRPCNKLAKILPQGCDKLADKFLIIMKS